MTALVRLTAGFQPEIVPSSVSNRNRAGPDKVPAVTVNPLVALKTVPVGVPGPEPEAGGMVNTRGEPGGNGWPWPLYSVENPVKLSETQKGLVELKEMPHGLRR